MGSTSAWRAWLCALLLAPGGARGDDAPVAAAAGDAIGTREASAAARFDDDARALYRVVACAGGGALPSRVPSTVVALHCARLGEIVARYRSRWVAEAQPFLAGIVPPSLPERVVYPFGGGDLSTALTTFPAATEITTLSLEKVGDPRALARLDTVTLIDALAEARILVHKLYTVSHSKTENMQHLGERPLPGQLVLALVALAVHGYEPVELRFFHLADDGSIRYLTDEELRRADAAPRSVSRERFSPTHPFDSMELVFRAHGDAGGLRVYRHIAANLDDTHVARTPGVLKHLEDKGTITAITKAASYLLWWRQFSRIRDYLLGHMAWMVSDSTGIPIPYARAAGFEQRTYGVFEGPYFPGGRVLTQAELDLWSSQPIRRLPFFFGYPDRARHPHLVVTYRPH